ncbi:hypothetical protein NBRC13296_23435 [Paenibacillus chitinolyticus]|uniref:hypothetical protein n=1 Tax=Paenibacillus chitinolyticus TaxID=79263 RepID=UPI0035575B98
MITVKDIIEFVSDGEKFNFCCSAFLDSFYAAVDQQRIEMIKDEPEAFPDVEHFYYCHVAAMTHKLANDFKLIVPEWVHKEKYILTEPHYDIFDKNNEILKKYLEDVSPYEFKIRNIFVKENALDRV